jgi:hypothetical protein
LYVQEFGFSTLLCGTLERAGKCPKERRIKKQWESDSSSILLLE